MASTNHEINRLRDVLHKEDTIIFVGSGISTWSALPTWETMMCKLAKFCRREGKNADLVRQEIAQGNLLQAASYGYDELNLEQQGRFIQSMYHNGATPHEIHKKLVSLGSSCFITTNYDDLLEQAVKSLGRTSIQPCMNGGETEMARIVHANAKNFIFKPHGDANNVKSIVLTRKQYRNLMPHGSLHTAMETLRILLMTRNVVYIGFGFRDPDFSYVRDTLGNLYQGVTPAHYAIMADISPKEQNFWQQHDGIHITSYKTTKSNIPSIKHKTLLKLLDSLSS